MCKKRGYLTLIPNMSNNDALGNVQNVHLFTEMSLKDL